MATQLVGLFPTPLMRVERLLDPDLLASLLARVDVAALSVNAKSTALSHTSMVRPDEDPLYQEVARRLAPPLAEFGAALFGESLRWRIKEMWLNVLDPGGQQGLHSHANSFASGVLYLTPTHPSALTVFHKPMGGTEFVFSNTHDGTRTGPYNGTRWVLPVALPGDLVLFPSYLLHEVPVNQGERRVTIAFNALPNRLDSWGYAIDFFA